MNLAVFSLRNPVVVWAVAILGIVWGVITYFTVPRSEDSPITTRICTVSTAWPGQSAGKIEQLLTEPLEHALDALDVVDLLRSTSYDGLSVIYVEVDPRRRGIAVENAWNKVRARVAKAAGELPREASPPVVDTEFVDTAVLELAVFQVRDAQRFPGQPVYTPRQLERLAERIKDSLELLPPVATVDLHGVRQEVIYLEVEAGVWSQLELAVGEVESLLQQRNIVLPGGVIEAGASRIGVRATGEFNAVDEINRLVVGGRDGRPPVYLRDLGLTARRTFLEPPLRQARYTSPQIPEGVPCVVVSLTMKEGQVITELGRQAKATLERLRQTVLPPDVQVVVLADQAEIVTNRIHDFILKLGQAVLLVVLVAYLMIGLRIALIMAAAIPITIVTSLGIVRLFGVQIEQISIVSFIIALGMLVDNAIEVCDNIHRLLNEGYSRRDAARLGAGEIAKPILMATLTTVFAFLPMLTIPGDPGEFLRSLPVVVSTTLLVSWLVVMSVTLLMAYSFLRPGGASPLAALGRWRSKGKPAGDADPAAATSIRRAYGMLAAACLRGKLTTILMALLLFAAGVWLVVSGRIGTQFFPADDRNQFVVDIFLPEGASIAATEAVARQVEQLIVERSRQALPDGQSLERLASLLTFVGTAGPRFYITLEPAPDAPNYAFMLVTTTSREHTAALVDELRRAAAAQLPGCRVVPSVLMKGPPVKAPLAIRVLGESPQVLARHAERIKQALRDTGEAWDIHDSWGEYRPELVIDTLEDRAKPAGVSQAQVAASIDTFFSGRYLTTFREGDHEIPVILRLPPEQRRSLDGLTALHVDGQHGKIPLPAVADLRWRWAPAKIERHRKTRSLEVRARPLGNRLANAVLAKILPVLESVSASLPPGYRLEIGGEQEETTRSQKDMGFALQIAVMLIMLSLVVHHQSFVKPFVLLLILPMAVTGALFGLYLTGQPLGFMAMLGLLSLVGVALNDALVYTQFAETLIREKAAGGGAGAAGPGEKSCGGLTVGAFHACLVQAGQIRMLPILLTTLTTVGGLLPLAFFGGAFWQPLAVAIIFGLLFSTTLTLLLLPCVFAVFVEHLRMKV